ncbi:hypothetical protein KUTeg_015519 [Tegillarca granosa]|uniref:Fibronectin type-III domain-containing protein n=1 Tax=Tegillarca granosa TaxID=220873 RepID=A0ABQ9EUS8_TEGGR|nr:hypothetical protein KUTeg_015519 [Tegillarca granosa]
MNGSEFITQVGQENYYSLYDVKVQAFNNYGDGPNSTAVRIYSAEDCKYICICLLIKSSVFANSFLLFQVPVAVVTNANAWRYNSTACKVTWDIVPDVRETMKGTIMGYQVSPILYPTEVHVYSHGPNSVMVYWRGVSTGTNEEPLQGYKLRYWTNGDDIRTANDVTVGKDTKAVIYGIQKDILYNLRVLGYSRGGDGNKGNTIYFTLGKTNLSTLSN